MNAVLSSILFAGRARSLILAAGFGIDFLAFSILSTHFHLILGSRSDVVATWDDTEVARLVDAVPCSPICQSCNDKGTF